ncbi:MAG TPA: hypothetical protein VE843_18755, partial [Ktedonobacteraceae bacterium]|nr:hypothetical protein [Ktedonobacteraceae bacterium]
EPVPLDLMTEQWCNNLIRRAMISQGLSEIEIEAVFDALREFGALDFKKDRAAFSQVATVSETSQPDAPTAVSAPRQVPVAATPAP